jgi:hypothetical protein
MPGTEWPGLNADGADEAAPSQSESGSSRCIANGPEETHASGSLLDGASPDNIRLL